MSFVVKKIIKLDFLGDGWENAYVVFKPFSFGENSDLLKLRKRVSDLSDVSDEDVEKITNDMLKLLTDKLIEGKGWDGEKLVDITKDNISELPMETFNNLLQQLQGGQTLSPKA